MTKQQRQLRQLAKRLGIVGCWSEASTAVHLSNLRTIEKHLKGRKK